MDSGTTDRTHPTFAARNQSQHQGNLQYAGFPQSFFLRKVRQAAIRMFTFGVQKKEDEAIETIDANSCSLMAERVHTVQGNVYRVVEVE